MIRETPRRRVRSAPSGSTGSHRHGCKDCAEGRTHLLVFLEPGVEGFPLETHHAGKTRERFVGVDPRGVGPNDVANAQAVPAGHRYSARVVSSTVLAPRVARIRRGTGSM